MQLYEYFLIYIFSLSFITLFAYFIDKVKAKVGAWRISEKVLITLSAIGGALGGLIAMYMIRHKTKHWYFTVINLLSICLHAVILILLINIA